MKTPYLIQRGKIKSASADSTFHEAIQLDYMGSAEFEFGSLPRALHHLLSNQDKIQRTAEHSIMDDGALLRVLHIFNEVEYTEYQEYLKRMRGIGAPLRLKESSYFDVQTRQSLSEISKDVDVWWDIENHVIWSFNKTFMNHLPDILRNTPLPTLR